MVLLTQQAVQSHFYERFAIARVYVVTCDCSLYVVCRVLTPVVSLIIDYFSVAGEQCVETSSR